MFIDTLDLLFGARFATVVDRGDHYHRNVSTAFGDEFGLMIVEVLLDLGICGSADAGALALSQGVDCELSANFVADFVLGESSFLYLLLVLLFGHLSVLLTLLNLLIDLGVIRYEGFLLGFLKESLI